MCQVRGEKKIILEVKIISKYLKKNLSFKNEINFGMIFHES